MKLNIGFLLILSITIKVRAMSKVLKYRPDLDGIRALAVLSVIIFHIDPQWLPGGFLGVDMFFVLSGYLITTIISREIRDGSFSFLEFYKRRAKRILPVFACVLLCTTVVAAIFFLSFDLRQYVKSAVYALLFAANLFFARRGGYFDADATEKPLQHIWSLSLEEQFYFIFPALLILFFRISKRRNVRTFILLLIVISLFSALLPTLGMEAYFLPHVRAYELLVGSLFAFIPPAEQNDKASTPLFGWLMMAVIAATLVLPYGVLPGAGNIERLLCCLAVGGLIYSGKSLQMQEGFNTSKLLSLKPVVFVGLISYSLYLWHWVVLALMRYIYMDAQLPLAASALAVIIMLLLSVLSYYFVETPARKAKNFTTAKFKWSMAAYFALLIPAAAYLMTAKPAAFESSLYKADESKICADTLTKTDCAVGAANQKPEVLVIGDSHAAHLSPFLDIVGKKEGWSADVITSNSCATAFGFVLPDSDRRADRCNPYNRFIEQKTKDYPVIIISQRWFLHTAKPEFLERFNTMLEDLVKAGKKVYVLADTPMDGQLPLRRYYLRQKLGIDINYVSEDKKAEIRDSAKSEDEVEKIVKQHRGVQWVDFMQYIPADKFIDGLPVYFDTNHLNPFGSSKIAEMFINDKRTLLK